MTITAMIFLDLILYFLLITKQMFKWAGSPCNKGKLTSVNNLWIWVLCSSCALFMSRLACFSWASAFLISSERASTSVTSSRTFRRHFEAASVKDEQLWPLCSSFMHSLQTKWRQSSSNKRNRSLCSWQKTVTSDDSKETTWWSRVALLRVWMPAATLHISSWQFRQKEVAGCSTSQDSQVYKHSTASSCWGVTFALVMFNNAKFFGRPATPAGGTLTSFLHVGQRILLSAAWVSKRSRQPVQKLWPQLSIRGQIFWSSYSSQQTGHSSTSADAIAWNKTENMLELNLCTVRLTK